MSLPRITKKRNAELNKIQQRYNKRPPTKKEARLFIVSRASKDAEEARDVAGSAAFSRLYHVHLFLCLFLYDAGA